MLKTITDARETLDKLMDQGVNQEMELSRQIRSTGRLFSLTTKLSRNVFNAIRCSLSCRCPVSHSVNLELQIPTVHPTPYDDEETLVQQISFRLTLMYDSDSRKAKQTTWLWDEVEMRAEVEQHPEALNSMALRSPSPNPSGKSKKPKKRVNFDATPAYLTTPSFASSGLGGQRQTMNETKLPRDALAAAESGFTVGTAVLGIPKKEGTTRDLEDLCHAIEESKRSARLSALSCYGYVTDKTASTYNKFGVYPVQHPQTHQDVTGEWSILSLRQVLETDGVTPPQLKFRHKQILAVTIASSVLQLANSPWLSETFDCEDILFVNLDGKPSYDHVFVSKRMPERDQPRTPLNPGENIHSGHAISGMIQNRTIFSLGVVLLELALGKRIRSLRKPPTTGLHSPDEASGQRDILFDYQTALQHLDKVSPEMGTYYYDAVRRCIKFEFMHPTFDLEDEEFRQEIYRKVVALLEKNLKDMNSSTKAFC